MKKIIVKDNKIPNVDRNVACIGYFDGVHKGHQSLINFTNYLARNNGYKSMIICFDPDPIDVINSNNKHKHLLSKKDRLASFESLGIDIVCIISFDRELMELSPLAFINNYLLKLNIDTLVCGYDFKFGYLGKGNSKLLSKSLNTVVIDQISYYGKKISSTRIRDAIKQGNFKLSNKLLGYDYSLTLKVVNIVSKGYKSLIEAKSVNNKLIIPNDGKYNGYTIQDGNFYFDNIKDISIGDIFILVFKNE